MRRRQLLRLALGGSLAQVALGSLAGCSSSPAMVLIAGARVEAAEIDRDPFQLMPKGVVVLGTLDLSALYATDLGRDAAVIAQKLVPIGAESNFSPARDTTRVVAGIYAMQGVDFCAVVSGRFDVAAIQRAADARAMAPSGIPLVKTRYGTFDLYTVGNIGFVLLTPNTLLSGNETGMRRALDRLRFSKLGRVLPEWMISVAETKNANFAAAGDFGADSVLAPTPDGGALPELRPSGSPAEPVLEAAAANLPFLSGLRALRVLGNFRPPGLNFAGALTYATPEKASAGAVSVRSLADLGQWVNLLASFGMGSAIAPAQIAVQGSDVAIVQPVDTTLARTVLTMIAATLGK